MAQNHNVSSDRVRAEYERRQAADLVRYRRTDPWVLLSQHEKEAAIAKWLRARDFDRVDTKTVLELGTGTGTMLSLLLGLGFSPHLMTGVELLSSNADIARSSLPASVRIQVGDAFELPPVHETYDVVVQSVLFTSISGADRRRTLADRMWTSVAPGGGILWYDFIRNNPTNSAVQAVSRREILALFPEHRRVTFVPVTLAPPLGRLVARWGPLAYHLANLQPLRTHVLAWIER